MLFPFEHNTKSEIYSFIMRQHPTLVDYAWTCMNPSRVKKIKDGFPVMFGLVCIHIAVC